MFCWINGCLFTGCLSLSRYPPHWLFSSLSRLRLWEWKWRRPVAGAVTLTQYASSTPPQSSQPHPDIILQLTNSRPWGWSTTTNQSRGNNLPESSYSEYYPSVENQGWMEAGLWANKETVSVTNERPQSRHVDRHMVTNQSTVLRSRDWPQPIRDPCSELGLASRQIICS